MKTQNTTEWTDLFIYGTLLPGCRLNEQISGCLCRGPVMLEGAKLHDLRFFPGLVEGEGFTIGEWITVSPKMLEELDQLEGYRPERDPDDCLYLRKTVEIQRLSDGKPFSAEAYFFNVGTNCPPPIEQGCYRRFLDEKKQGGRWVVAFGSNLNRRRIEARVGAVKEGRIGWIPDFELVFNKQSVLDDQETFANIKYNPGTQTPAVAWWLERSQINLLDEFEGVPDHYLRIIIPFVERNNDDFIEYRQAYVAHPKALGVGIPSKSYIRHLAIGYRENELGEFCWD